MIEETNVVQRELMDRLRVATTAVGTLERWIGYPGVITYDRYWSSALHTLAADEMRELQVRHNVQGYKRLGFLRRGSGGEPLAFVQAVVLRHVLPPWAVFEMDNSAMTIGEMIVTRMHGARRTLSVEPITEFDQTGEPLCIKVRACLDGVPHGGDQVRPLALVTEKIYSRVLEMRW